MAEHRGCHGAGETTDGARLRRSLSTKTDRAIFAAILAVVAAMSLGMMGGIGVAGASVAIAQYQYDKVTICHITGSGKTLTITVAASAVPAHRRHGDIVGFCPR
jgi:uncharacterized membrane protein YfcA